MANLFIKRVTKQGWILFCLGWLVFAAGACKKSTHGGVIQIGEVGVMTGGDATFGISTHRGIVLALNELNALGGIHGKQLKLVTLDDQGKASEAILAMNQLIYQQKVHAILGEAVSSLTLAIAPIAQKAKVPLLTPSSIHSKITEQGDYIFQTCFLDVFQSQVMAKFALQNLKVKRAAILRDSKSDTSQDSSKIFTKFFKNGGGQIVMDQSYSSGDIDFRSQLTAIRSVSPDVILIPGHYTEIGLIARQGRELGIRAPYLGGDGWDSPKLFEIGGSALEGSYFVSHFAKDDPSPHVQQFIQAFQAAFGEMPDGLAALGYDAARVLGDSLNRAKSSDPADLREAIASTKDFQGVTGKITLNTQRHALKSGIVFKIGKNGQIKSDAMF